MGGSIELSDKGVQNVGNEAASGVCARLSQSLLLQSV